MTVINQTINVHQTKEKKLKTINLNKNESNLLKKMKNKQEFKQKNATSKELLENYKNSKINEKIVTNKKENLKIRIENSSIELKTPISNVNKGTLDHHHIKTKNIKDLNDKTKQELNIHNNKTKHIRSKATITPIFDVNQENLFNHHNKRKKFKDNKRDKKKQELKNVHNNKTKHIKNNEISRKGIKVHPSKKSFKENNFKKINVNKNESNMIKKMKNKNNRKQKNVTSKELLLFNYLKNYKIYFKDKNFNQKVSKYNIKKEKVNKTLEKSLDNTKFSQNKFKHSIDRKDLKEEKKQKIHFHQSQNNRDIINLKYNLQKESNLIKKTKNEIEQNNKNYESKKSNLNNWTNQLKSKNINDYQINIKIFFYTKR
jgi:hypothetical protein